MHEEDESCAGIPGIMLSSDLWKIVDEILRKAKEEVVVLKAVRKAHCLKTMTVSKQS